MTIKRYKDGDEVIAGQYVNFSGMHMHTFASVSCKVLEVKPASISVIALEEEATPRLKMKRLIAFVCDTEEESLRLRDASRAFLKLAMEKEGALSKELVGIKRNMIDLEITRK